MEKETVFQISIERCHAPRVSPQTRKEIVFGLRHQHTHRTTHLFQKLTKFLHSLLLQSQLILYAQLVSIQMDLETVLLHLFQLSVQLDMKVMDMENVKKSHQSLLVQ